MSSSTAESRTASIEEGAPTLVPVSDAFQALIDLDPHGILSAAERRAAFEQFQRLPVLGGRPGRDWKHDYVRTASEIPDIVQRTRPAATEELPERLFSEAEISTDVLMNGAKLSVAPSDLLVVPYGIATQPGVGRVPSLTEDLLGDESWRNDKFANLALAFVDDAVAVRVEAGKHVERPILIRAVANGRSSRFPFISIILEPGARVTIVEDLVGDGFLSGIVDARVSEGASLDYVVLQRTGPNAKIFMNRSAVCAADATCRFHIAELGGELSRSVVSTRLEGRGASTEVNALFYNDKDQHVDLSSLVEHNVGPSSSRTTVKSAARERGQGRYLGNIRIAQHANGSDAALRDDALLLSRHAHIDSVPALEIASNDVKAFHGATVGSIDEDELFYAQSRGIPRNEAERMIALGFFEPVIAAMPLSPIRDVVRAALEAKSGGSAGVAEGA